MTRSWDEQTGTLTLEFMDTGELVEAPVIERFREEKSMHGASVVKDRLKTIGRVNGHGIYTPDEENFFFDHLPNRPMRIKDGL